MANLPNSIGAQAGPTSGTDRFRAIFQSMDILFAFGIIGILLILLVPVPPFLMDLLLSISITFSVLILMTVLFIHRPLDFSTFPTILLIAAMFRLSLNIGTTRLILAHGHEGSNAAGHVIEAFGGFVMGGSVVIGVIVFGILTIINFVVITKGSGRIAEVAARFSLDAMPGKQMAIDADLSAGIIDENQAKERRSELEDESSFFGAMDGASKFVRGDAVAGLLITFINFIGGMVIGIVQLNLSFEQAVTSYTMLTIGDGLVSQIPALVVSTAAGILVSKAGIRGTANTVIFGQIGKYPQALGMVSVILFLIALLPGMPFLPFAAISALTGAIAWKMQKRKENPQEAEGAAGMAGAAGAGKSAANQATGPQKGSAGSAQAAEDEPIKKVLEMDTIRLELGYGLLPLINYENGTRLPDQVKSLRKQMARDMGFVLPSVRIQDNMQLGNTEYVVRIKDIECARGVVRPDMLLVMDPSGGTVQLPGEETTEPAFGLPAKWVGEGQREEALFKKYTVVNPPTVITTHLTEVVKDNITELLSYSECKKLLENLDEDHQKLLTDTVPDKISMAGIQRVLQNLLIERISIRDLGTILEATAEAASGTKNISQVTEYVRMRLARQISHDHLSPKGYVPLVTLSPHWEQIFSENLHGAEGEASLSIPPSKLQEFIGAVKSTYDRIAMTGEDPVLLVSPAIRPYVRSVIERFRPLTTVMSQNEIHPKVKIKTLGQV